MQRGTRAAIVLALSLCLAACTEPGAELGEQPRSRDELPAIVDLLFPNRTGPGGLLQRYPADAPLMRALWRLSAAYGVPLSVHMDADPVSVAAMERLLASDRNGRWIWAHCGSYADPAEIARLLELHSNLSCELSYRESIRPASYFTTIDLRGVLRPEWVSLLEQFPERFTLGTDLDAPSLEGYAESIAYWRRILAQLNPNAAALIAGGNAVRLLRLPPATAP
jgi:predicted TIM-barrel fold metal-dependent hydrolase